MTDVMDDIVGYLWDYFDIIKDYKFAGTRINITGFTMQKDDIKYCFVQPNTKTLKGSYWDAEPTKDWRNDYGDCDSFVKYIKDYAQQNPFGDYPVSINGYTKTHNNGIRFRFVQPDIQTLEGSYWIATPIKAGREISFLDFVLGPSPEGYNGYYTDYPIYIDGFRITDSRLGIRLRFVQPDTQSLEGSYWIAESILPCPAELLSEKIEENYEGSCFYGYSIRISSTNPGLIP